MSETAQEFYPRLYKGIAQINEALGLKLLRDGMQITCKGPGCSHCCSEPVYSDNDEAAYIVSRLNPAQVSALTLALERWLEAARASGLLDVLKPAVNIHTAMRVKCPLLSEEGHCSIYAFRPGACRSHNATGHPKWCDPDYIASLGRGGKAGQMIVSPGAEVYIQFMDYYADKKTDNDHFAVHLCTLVLGTEIRTPNFIRMELADERIPFKSAGEC